MILSIITSGRNDNYAGNFLERIKFNIVKINESLKNLKIFDIEFIVVDWASETKLSDTIHLEQYGFIKFLFVDGETANRVSPDNSFSHVHALNAGYRKSSGKYIFFIDGDSYLPTKTINNLYSFCLNLADEESYYYASRYHIPYEIHSNCENINCVDLSIDNWVNNGKKNWKYDNINPDNIFSPMGIFISRVIAESSSCYYEKLNKWGYIETEFTKRLNRNYKCGGDLMDFDMCFFHLDHHSIGTQGVDKKFNQHIDSDKLHANSDDWGLIYENLKIYKK